MTSSTFSIVMAAYNRGRHILPSIRSVLNQDFQDFELVVVGDGCTDDTGKILEPLLSPQVRWFNLPMRGGSQSFANNEGIARSTGRYIAYLGHDDVWASNHLSALSDLIQSEGSPDFAVSGTIFHGPRASNYREVTGILIDEIAPWRHFFPPSSIAHRRDVVERIGPWANPLDISAPVDAEFQIRASNAGMSVASTQQVTVHKFAAGHRYLSYLNQASDEQSRMLRRLSVQDHGAYAMAEVDRAKAAGTFMISRHADYSKYKNGELYELSGRSRGIVRPQLNPLRGRETIKQDNHPRALDWRSSQDSRPQVRWIGRNPRPKLLIPFSYPGQVEIRLNVWSSRAENLDELALAINGAVQNARMSRRYRSFKYWRAVARFAAPLKPDDFTILEFHLNKSQRPKGNEKRFGVGTIKIVPLEGLGPIARMRRAFVRLLDRTKP